MKTNLDSIFKTDGDLEQKGAWYEVSPGVAFLIKRFGGFNSPKIKASMTKYYKPFAKQIENGIMDPAKEKEILTKVFVEACVMDWKGIEIDGEVVPFSQDACVKLFVSLPEMTELLIQYSSDFKNYKEELGNF